MHQAVEARESNGPRQPGGGLRRVSVYADSHHVDLVLSALVPIGSLMPPIVDILAEGGHRAQTVAALHQLSLPGKMALDPSKTLAQSGIPDGTTLILTSSATVWAEIETRKRAQSPSTTIICIGVQDDFRTCLQ